MTTKRVFILGAGFSKQAGMPLAMELTTLILNQPRLKSLDDMQAWAADFKQRLAAAEGEDIFNIEQVFNVAAYDEELHRMRQQLWPFGRNSGDAPWIKAEGISAWLSYMEEELPHVIWDSQQKADLKPIERFTHRLSPEDTILTFNYDTLVETSLSAQQKAWNHGLDDHGDGGVTVLKMHGSIDWLLLKRRPEKDLQKFRKLFSKKYRNVEQYGHPSPTNEEKYAWELWRAKDTNACNAIIEMDKCGLRNLKYHLGLVGLGSHKFLHELPGSAPTWARAFDAIAEAQEIYVVGFSMSPYDNMTRFHFTSVVRARKTPPARIVVIDPKAVHFSERFHVVFGDPLTLIQRTAESIDWEKVMG